jgi:selenide,water dikinase
MACEGDLLILTKPIGTGIIMTARKAGMVDNDKYQDAIKVMSSINTPGEWLGEEYTGVHAITDVTGFGLLGHMHEICKESKVSANINFDNIPILDNSISLIKEGIWPSSALHNLNDVENIVNFSPDITSEDKILLCDPQTNGGLLFTCTHSIVNEVIERLKHNGFDSTSIIGEICAQDKKNTILISK